MSDWRTIIDVLADPVLVSHVRPPENGAMILKSETYHFHRLDLTRQAGFIVTIYDEQGLRACQHAATADAFAGVRGSTQDRGQQNRRAEEA